MPEPDLYKDKIEVSLDGRQIFYLFFGGAVIVGLVFVLGVMVGRRVEARDHVDHARTQATRDPLAALDQLERREALSFQRTLTGSPAAGDVERVIEEVAPPPTAPDAPGKKPEPRADRAAATQSAPGAEPVEAKRAEEKKRARFTLQLSSFQDRKEADTFLGSVKAAGYQAYVTEAEVSGKTFYRVRFGKYRTMEAANEAKGEVEKALETSASVMRL
jgi:DedD protein